jgi:hypothetical protein
MAATVYQTNKKTGITYAYESISHWDKEKQQSRARRKCIGLHLPLRPHRKGYRGDRGFIYLFMLMFCLCIILIFRY